MSTNKAPQQKKAPVIQINQEVLHNNLSDYVRKNLEDVLSSASSGDPQNERKLTPSVLSRGPGTGQRGSSWYSRV